jgi:hypothetical protein
LVVFGGGKDGAFYKELSELVGTARAPFEARSDI